MPQEPVPGLLRRTMFNLSFIESSAGSDGPYETTQLVNSFLAGLAHPWEKYKQELKQKTIEDAVRDGWPELRKKQDSVYDPKNLGDLLRLVRNSFAHGNLEFQSTQGNKITHIRFWNEDPKQDYRPTWGTIASTDDMRKFLTKFAELAKSLAAANLERKRHEHNGHD